MINKLLLLPVAFLLHVAVTYGQSCVIATCPATTPGFTDVLNALPASGNTNPTVTVTIPVGSATWSGSTPINYTVPSAVTTLIIQGATTVNCTGTPGTSGYGCTATDNTVISDGMSSNFQLEITTVGASSKLRITGLTFKGSASGATKFGTIALFGPSQNIRVDHNHFSISGYVGVTAAWVRTYGPEEGVIDHNVVDDGPNLATSWNAFQAVNTTQSIGDSIGNGDGTWAAPTGWGNSHWLFVEANQINGGYGNDCEASGLEVLRYNTFNGANLPVQTHATKSDGGSIRGCRGIEFYKNYASNSNEGAAGGFVGGKGGPYLIWGNTSASNTQFFFLNISTDRNTNDQGENPTPTGWGFVGPTPIANGTTNVSAPAGGVYTLTGTGFSTSWPTGSNILIANAGGGSTTGWADFVINTVSSSTSMTAHCTALPSGGTCPAGALSVVLYGVGSAWDGNHTSNGYPALDGLGRGQTAQALNGANLPGRLNSITGTIAWPQQMLEPIYSCGNTYPGSTPVQITDNTTTLNVDVFMDNASFTGTTGCGSGLLASRPATCTAGPGGTFYTSPTGSYGVAYWATDANSGNGELYVCTSANTWTGIYQPYVFPHPLDVNSGTVATPTFSPVAGTYGATQNVTISTATGGATLCYTTDGSTPTEVANACSGGTTQTYTGPVAVASSLTLKAIGTLSGSTDSAVGSAAYTITTSGVTHVISGKVVVSGKTVIQ